MEMPGLVGGIFGRRSETSSRLMSWLPQPPNPLLNLSGPRLGLGTQFLPVIERGSEAIISHYGPWPRKSFSLVTVQELSSIDSF